MTLSLLVIYGEERSVPESNREYIEDSRRIFSNKPTFSMQSKLYWWLFFGPWTWLFRILSWALPKQTNLYVFGSNEGELFSDNSRALFEYVKIHEPHIKAIWFTKSDAVFREVESKFPGSVVKSPSIRASYIYIRAEQAIISYGFQDLCKMPWVPSIKTNQLWHGIPIKKIGLLRDGRKTISDYGPTWPIFTKWADKVDKFFVASDYEMKAHIQAFKIPENKFKITGNPRNERLLNSEVRNQDSTKVILYAPTFRSRDRIVDNILMHPNMDERRMHNFLAKNNARLIVRPHWIDPETEYSSDRIECITHELEPDLYRLFMQSDILVTDYSSAFIDWLILDRPVVFSPYDIEDYEQKNGFLAPYEKLVPPPICKNPTELLRELQNAIDDANRHHEERLAARSFFHGDLKPGISKRILDEIEKNKHTDS